jgi:hypothetical protein
VGTVVKKKPGNGPIIAPSDANGESRLTGLEPGEYTVQVFEGGEETTMRVGEDGRLAFVAYEDIKRAGPAATPSRRRWAEAISFDKASSTSVVLDVREQFAVMQPRPCDPLPGRPETCNRRPPMQRFIDVNTSPEAEITRLARTLSPEAARVITTERSRAPFTGASDFARRVCSKVAVDFDDAPIKMGDFLILMKRGLDPNRIGWNCQPRDNMVRQFTSWLTYDAVDKPGAVISKSKSNIKNN